MSVARVALCVVDEEEEIKAIRVLKVHFSPEAAVSLKENHGVSFTEEIARVISEEVKNNVTPELIAVLLKEAGVVDE